MPVDPKEIDELTALLIRQSIREFKRAEENDEPMDPRRLANAARLLELADPRALTPAQRPLPAPPTPTTRPGIQPSVKSMSENQQRIARQGDGRWIKLVPMDDDEFEREVQARETREAQTKDET